MNNPIDKYDTDLRRAINEVLVSMLKDHNWKVTSNAGNPIMYLAGTDTTVTSLEGICWIYMNKFASKAAVQDSMFKHYIQLFRAFVLNTEKGFHLLRSKGITFSKRELIGNPNVHPAMMPSKMEDDYWSAKVDGILVTRDGGEYKAFHHGNGLKLKCLRCDVMNQLFTSPDDMDIDDTDNHDDECHSCERGGKCKS